jgi:cellulose synthase/poly-beta-1,6-N-acetylglucosamine synthase-like glycosyltransferase
MRCPSLNELPPPPPHVTGWPWTEESRPLPAKQLAARPWPRITIVTPSFNQGCFIEETIRSILLQGYPDLEYFVFDGGSTDSTVEIIRKYSPWIRFWISEPDRGQSAAINRGLRRGSGLYAAWVCSDDMLCRDALTNLLMSGELAPDTLYIGDCIHIDEGGNALFVHRGNVWNFEDLVKVGSVWRSQGWIDQPAVVFTLKPALRAGGLNENNHLCMDFEFWGQLLLAGAKIHYTGKPFGAFRRQPDQKTQDDWKQTTSTIDAAERLVSLASFLPAEAKQKLLEDLDAYRRAFFNVCWRQSGRLARIGLPPSIVMPVRKFRIGIRKTADYLMHSNEGSK